MRQQAEEADDHPHDVDDAHLVALDHDGQDQNQDFLQRKKSV